MKRLMWAAAVTFVGVIATGCKSDCEKACDAALANAKASASALPGGAGVGGALESGHDSCVAACKSSGS